MIIPEELVQEHIENLSKIHSKNDNPKHLKQRAGENLKTDDEKLKKELDKKMINPHNFADRAFQVGYIITLDSHYINQATSKLRIKPN